MGAPQTLRQEKRSADLPILYEVRVAWNHWLHPLHKLINRSWFRWQKFHIQCLYWSSRQAHGWTDRIQHIGFRVHRSRERICLEKLPSSWLFGMDLYHGLTLPKGSASPVTFLLRWKEICVAGQCNSELKESLWITILNHQFLFGWKIISIQF